MEGAPPYSGSSSDSSDEYETYESFDVSLEDYFQPVSLDYRSTEYQQYRSLNTIAEEDEPVFDERSTMATSEPRLKTSTSSTNSDGPRKIKNSIALDSLFADLDQDLEQQYEEEEFEFFMMETQCIAEELIDEAIHGALEEMYADLAEKLRLDKIEASKNEISCENLIKPSELIKRQRSARSKTEKPSVQIKNDQAVNKDNERQIEQHDAVEHDRLSDPTLRESLDENSNKEKHEFENMVPTKPPRILPEEPTAPDTASIDLPAAEAEAEENKTSQVVTDVEPVLVPELVPVVEEEKTDESLPLTPPPTPPVQEKSFDMADQNEESCPLTVVVEQDEVKHNDEQLQEETEKVELPKRKAKGRQSIKLSRKRPNYADKVWKNISCLAAEVDELDTTSTTSNNNTQQKTVQKKRPKRKSFCSLQ